MTLSAWQQDKNMAAWSKKIFGSAEGQEFLRMLEESHLRHFHGHVADPALELGKIQGYDICINNIVASCSYQKEPKELVATFDGD